jgi:putative inorganic carbon (hco3(-)) transporter
LGFAAAVWLLYAFPRIGLYAVIFLTVIGELIRIPVATENGILISDVIIPIFVIVWAAKKITQKKPFPASKFSLPFAVFCAVAAISLLQAFLFITPSEVLTSSFYLIRLVSYVLLILVTVDCIEDESHAKKILSCIFAAAFLIAVAGFIQLAVYPDLGKLATLGWDPHINRLVSVWLDPNFVGGYLAFITCILLGVILYAKKTAVKTGLSVLAIVLTLALFLTYSRSAYVAFAAGILIIGALKSRTLIITGVVLAIIGLAVFPRAAERLNDLSHTITAIVFDTSENPDATARLRIKSWEQTWELVYKRPILGSGYNTLRYVKYDEGFVTDPDIHSASGSDSSLLTILATTGILGLIAFIWFYAQFFLLSYRGWKLPAPTHEKTPDVFNGFSLGMLAGISSLTIHSLFVNSLLFPQIMIPLLISVGILEWHVKIRSVIGRG